MPTERRPLHRAHRSRLSYDAEMELWLGPSHRGSAFESAAQQQWAWTSNRDRLMQQYACNGKRPWAWWRLEMGRAHPGDHQASILYEMGQLGEEERAELESEWRREFTRAWAPDFWLCLGPGRVLEGVAARRRHLAWADV